MAYYIINNKGEILKVILSKDIEKYLAKGEQNDKS